MQYRTNPSFKHDNGLYYIKLFHLIVHTWSHIQLGAACLVSCELIYDSISSNNFFNIETQTKRFSTNHLGLK